MRPTALVTGAAGGIGARAAQRVVPDAVDRSLADRTRIRTVRPARRSPLLPR